MVDAPVLVDDEGWLAGELERMSPQAQRVFRVWLAHPKRSLKESAELAGVSYQVTREYSMRYGWKRTAVQYDERSQKDLLATLKTGIVSMSADAVRYAYKVLRDETQATKYRMDAAKWLASLGGLGPRSAPAVSDSGDPVVTLPMDELFKLARSGTPEDIAKLLELNTTT